MVRSFRNALAACVLACAGISANAADATIIYNKSEPKYFVDLLASAMEHTKDEGGYTLKPTEATMGNARALEELAENTGALHIITRGSNIEEEKRLLPIRIPLDKGLLGYRVLVIRKDDLARFAAIQSVEELKKLRTGQGSRWPDAKILAADGFRMSNGYYSAGLLRMLNEERFDMFPRATWEATGNIQDAEKQGISNLVIEPTLAIYYPYPRIFMVSRKGEGPALAARIEKGLRKMIADGSFDKMFQEFFGPPLEATQLRTRRIFKVENRFLSPETPFDDKSLWFSMEPETAKPAPGKKPSPTAGK